MSLFNNKLQKVQMGMLAQDVQDKFASTDEQLAQKAQQTDVNNALALKADKSTTDSLQSQLTGAISGSPIPITLASQMTDHTRNYVYLGSEGGYISGNIYYWNGSSFVNSGKQYQSTGIAVGSITKENVKDSEITPDRTSFFNINSSVNILDTTTITNGYYFNASGVLTADATLFASDFIDVHKHVGDTILSSAYTPRSQTTIQRVARYDANKNLIGVTASWINSYVVQSGDYYLRISNSASLLSQQVQYQYNTLQDYVQYSRTEQIPSKYIDGLKDTRLNVDISAGTVMLRTGAKITLSQSVDGTKNQNILRITKVEKGNYVFGQDFDYDGVLKITGNTDFSGGYHGHEQEVSKKYIVDGKIVTSFSGICDKFEIFIKSNVYSNDGTETLTFNKTKIITFYDNYYVIKNTYKCVIPVSIERLRTTLFSVAIPTGETGTSFTDIYDAVSDFNNSTANGTLFYAESISKIYCSLALSGGVICELLAQPNDTKRGLWSGSIEKFDGRVKPYIDCFKTYSAGTYEVLSTTSKYTIV